MGSKSPRRKLGRWSSQAKQIGLAAAKRMTGFNVQALWRWLESTYGPCNINFDRVAEAVANNDGEMAPIPGSEKLFMRIELRINNRPLDGENLMQAVSYKLFQMGVARHTIFTSSAATGEDGVVKVNMTWILPDLELNP